jgi:hypothetical protein
MPEAGLEVAIPVLQVYKITTEMCVHLTVIESKQFSSSLRFVQDAERRTSALESYKYEYKEVEGYNKETVAR